MADAGSVGGAGGPVVAGDQGFQCNCTKDTWPTLLFALGLAANVLVCIVAVTDLVGGNTAYIVLDVYLFVFGLIGTAAELRMFQSLRGVMFFVIKHVYFMARPCGRAVFYIFVASLTWTNEFQLLPWLTAIFMATIAVLTIGVDLIVGLPVFMDKEIQQTLGQTVRGAATDIAVDQARRELVGGAGGGGSGSRI